MEQGKEARRIYMREYMREYMRKYRKTEKGKKVMHDSNKRYWDKKGKEMKGCSK